MSNYVLYDPVFCLYASKSPGEGWTWDSDPQEAQKFPSAEEAETVRRRFYRGFANLRVYHLARPVFVP